jgi:hypothetical protein
MATIPLLIPNGHSKYVMRCTWFGCLMRAAISVLVPSASPGIYTHHILIRESARQHSNHRMMEKEGRQPIWSVTMGDSRVRRSAPFIWLSPNKMRVLIVSLIAGLLLYGYHWRDMSSNIWHPIEVEKDFKWSDVSTSIARQQNC